MEYFTNSLRKKINLTLKANGRLASYQPSQRFMKDLRTINFIYTSVKFSQSKDHVSGGKKCSFFGKFGVLCFLETPVLRSAVLPYYRRDAVSSKYIVHKTNSLT